MNDYDNYVFVIGGNSNIEEEIYHGFQDIQDLDNDQFRFLKIFYCLYMNDISFLGKFADCRGIKVFNNLSKRLCFHLIESMTTIDNPFNDEFVECI